MLAKWNPYRLEERPNGFVKYDGYFFSGFVMFTVFISVIMSVIIISSGAIPLLIIPIVPSAVMLTNNFYTEFDFKHRRYKEAYMFLGNEYGEWKKIPEMKYISLSGVTRSYTLQGTGDEDSMAGSRVNEDHFEVRIYIAYNKKIVLFEVNRYDKALDLAKRISRGLNEKLLDATYSPPEFI